MNHKIIVSGIINVETNVYADHFPIQYSPVRYLCNQVNSNVGGVAFNIANALATLSSDSDIPVNTTLSTIIGNNIDGKTVSTACKGKLFKLDAYKTDYSSTPHSVILYASDGSRMIFNDLKNIQSNPPSMDIDFTDVSLFVSCNVNFNRPLLYKAKAAGTLIATDVHVLSTPYDEYNREFMEAADILFLSDERISEPKKDFLFTLKEIYPAKVIVMGLGKYGALLYTRENDAFYYFSPVKNDNVVNTVGAGDSLFSSFLFYYVNCSNPISALTKAEIFASRKISFNGSSNGFSTDYEIQKAALNISIKIEKI